MTGQHKMPTWPGFKFLPGDEELGSEDEEGDEETSESFSEEPKDESVTLEKNCYSLVVVGVRGGGFWGGSKALLCVIGNSLAQMAVIYIVGGASPEYYFGNGAWLLPISEAWSTNAMKAFASVLTVFQVTQEMQDVSTIFRTLTHSPRLEEIRPRHRIQCLVALVLQYVFALVVLVVATQLVLSRQRPMDTLWITFYVFMTLNFDNNLCRFILFFFGLDLDWKFSLAAPVESKHRRWNRWYKRCGYVLFLVIPMVMTASIMTLAMACNICPLTWIRYGTVSNHNPVLMISPSLGLPQGCCPVKVHWSPNRTSEGTIPVLTSVPCLSRKPPEDDSIGEPELYWVAWPDRKIAPTSLQIVEGRGGDGTPAKASGKVITRPFQMRLWLMGHDYDSDAVYRYLIDASEGISLYRSKFTYVGEWNITGIAWEDRNRIFVTARNPGTGALSPTPVQSEILLRELCAPFCWRCADNGACLHCERGFALHGTRCLPCAEDCRECKDAGAGGCDRGMCKKGFGVSTDYVSPPGDNPEEQLTRAMGLGKYKNVCKPCAGGLNCSSCDTPEAAGTTGSLLNGELPCQACRDQLGLVNGTCQSCQIDFCETCGGAEECARCEVGFTRVQRAFGKEECLKCASNCTQCDYAGPGRCDSSQCDKGFTSEVDLDKCLSCPPHCLSCNVSGPGGCNQGQCEPGYTQNVEWFGVLGKCEACSAHCRTCSKPGECDKGGCESGFGLQGDPQCARCAEDNCVRCDESWHTCEECSDGYGFSSTKTCEKCQKNCLQCSRADRCTKCESGFHVSKSGKCVACADQCRSCIKSGEGFCDKGECEDGWTTVSRSSGDSNSSDDAGGLTCRPCVDPECHRCDLRGPEHCDTEKALPHEVAEQVAESAAEGAKAAQAEEAAAGEAADGAADRAAADAAVA